MSVDSTTWLSQYEQLKHDFQTQRKVSNQVSGLYCKNFLSRIGDLDKSLEIMRESPMQYDLWMSEIVRRQVTLENIKRQVNICNAGDANNSTYTSSAGGMAMSSGGSYISSTGSNGTSTVHNPLTTSDQGLLQRQRQVLQMQDAAILDIEKGVDRLHQTAIEIGKETKVQTKILDELDLHVDQATVGLKNEAKHAEEVNRKSEVCYMYICIIVEVIVLVILILILFIKV